MKWRKLKGATERNAPANPISFPPELREILIRGVEELGVTLPESGEQQFFQYLTELKNWGKRINLVGTTDERELVVQHFLDSLAPVPILNPDDFLLDLGSGAGLPGIPIKLALPEIRIVLLERRQKKSVFLRHTIRTLGLKGIEVVQGSAESQEIREVLAGAFDVIVSRATGKLKMVLKVGPSYLKSKGKLIVFKGPGGERELSEIDPREWGLDLVQRKDYSSSLLPQQRMLLVFQRN